MVEALRNAFPDRSRKARTVSVCMYLLSHKH